MTTAPRLQSVQGNTDRLLAQLIRVTQERDYYRQQDHDKHDLLTHPTLDGNKIKAFYALKVGLFSLRKKNSTVTRADGMTLVRLHYLAEIAGTLCDDAIGRHLRDLAEFGNGFVRRHLVRAASKMRNDLYFDIDETMRPGQFEFTPEKEDERGYQPRKPKKYEHCNTPGCPCSEVREDKTTTLTCADCGVVIKTKRKKTIIKPHQPYPDELDELPPIEEQNTEPLPVVRIVPLDCSHHLLHRDRWKTTGTGAHCPVCNPMFDM